MSFGGESRRVVLDEHDGQAAGATGAGFERSLDAGGTGGAGDEHDAARHDAAGRPVAALGARHVAGVLAPGMDGVPARIGLDGRDAAPLRVAVDARLLADYRRVLGHGALGLEARRVERERLPQPGVHRGAARVLLDGRRGLHGAALLLLPQSRVCRVPRVALARRPPARRGLGAARAPRAAGRRSRRPPPPRCAAPPHPSRAGPRRRRASRPPRSGPPRSGPPRSSPPAPWVASRDRGPARTQSREGSAARRVKETTGETKRKKPVERPKPIEAFGESGAKPVIEGAL